MEDCGIIRWEKPYPYPTLDSDIEKNKQKQANFDRLSHQALVSMSQDSLTAVANTWPVKLTLQNGASYETDNLPHRAYQTVKTYPSWVKIRFHTELSLNLCPEL